MSDATTPPQDDMHWGISYLREDIQDLRQEIRALHGRIDSTNQRIDTKFGQLLAAIVASGGIMVAAMFAMFQVYLPG